MSCYINTEVEKRLRVMYPSDDYTIQQICDELNYSKSTVMIYASHLGLKRSKKFKNSLSDIEEKLLRDNYEYGDLEVLSNTLNKSKHAIMELARKRQLRRKVNIQRNGDISILLDGSIQSFYWLGLLASDGYISNTGHLMLSQSGKDKEIIYKFAEYIKGTVYVFDSKSGYNQIPKTYYRVNIMDPVIGKRIRDMWGMEKDSKKTYSSITSDFIKTKNQAIAFLIGFFDGDGSLRNKLSGRIEVHSNWLRFLNELCDKAELDYTGTITNRGYASVWFGKSSMIIMKRFILENAIIHNHRKWAFEL